MCTASRAVRGVRNCKRSSAAIIAAAAIPPQAESSISLTRATSSRVENGLVT
jgi:hypothetical protein